jgi:hypothetical protein
MNCQQTQHLFDDLAAGRLPEPVAGDVRRHIGECTDCRVAQQRAARLQQLLALKRHEHPGSAYFDGFLNEFHRRLEAETAPRVRWWGLVWDQLTLRPAYGWAAAVTAVAVVGMFLFDPSSANPPVHVVAPNVSAVAVVSPPVVEHPDSPVLVASPAGPLRGIEAESASIVTPGGVVIMPAVAHSNYSAPRYVLDHIALTPVAYEAANVHF